MGISRDDTGQGDTPSIPSATQEQLTAINLEIGALKSVLIEAGVCTGGDLDTALMRLKEIWHGVL